uniref:Ig-like domain-containing protein n=1 Tax=Pygocentrus nattereri TaxID=42514 RepID=A0A3B4CCF0_PYGNA
MRDRIWRESANLTSVHSQIVLTQSERPVTVTPGGSHKLTCACSGFNVGDYWMGWIRQAPGKGLEWIIGYYTESHKSSAQSVQGRFTISRDTNSNVLFLDISSLESGDTAVYYCAKTTTAVQLSGSSVQKPINIIGRDKFHSRPNNQPHLFTAVILQ